MDSKVTNKLYNLQAIRGFAALSVCFHHGGILLNIPHKDIVFDSVVGAIGVPLFFIISGFIMHHTTNNLVGSPITNMKNFLLKRFIRIMPLFYFSAVCIFLIYHNTIIANFTTNLNNTIHFLLFMPLFTSKTGPAYGFGMLPTVWSLNYEMFFYVLFALSLLFVSKRYVFLYGLFFILVFAIPLLLVGQFSFGSDIYYNYHFKYLNFFTNPVLLLFITGVIISEIVTKIKIKKQFAYLSIVTTSIFFLLYYIKVIPYFKLADLIICGSFIFSILLLDLNTNVTPPKWCIYLGDISYSIYLIHFLIFIYLPLLINKSPIHKLTTSWFFLIVGFVVVILVSSITYEIIEIRFTKYLKQKFFRSKTQIS